jgi:hypothetical protein
MIYTTIFLLLMFSLCAYVGFYFFMLFINLFNYFRPAPKQEDKEDCTSGSESQLSDEEFFALLQRTENKSIEESNFSEPEPEKYESDPPTFYGTREFLDAFKATVKKNNEMPKIPKKKSKKSKKSKSKKKKK